MSRTLKEDLKRDFEEVFLNEKEFSEWVAYQPHGGGPSRRILVNVIKRTASVAPHGDLEMRDEEIVVECRKDEAGDKGGVAAPSRTGSAADTLLRDGDPPDARYSFTGRVEHENSDYWKLVFRRPRPTRIGTEQRR